MGDKTAIEWTDATWNPIRGCTRVSEGCRHCYAERVAARFSGPGQPYHGLATADPPRWTGKVRLIESALDLPLRWRRPRRIFVNSMSDLFHESVPDEWTDRIFATMARCPQHTFQVLTKRPKRMRDYIVAARGRFDDEAPWPLPNVWAGTSVEDQPSADDRIPELLATPAAVRFISYEPALGPVDLTRHLRAFNRDEMGLADDRLAAALLSASIESGHAWARPALHWIIVGGESGPGARPMHPDWARQVRDQCAAAGVAFFFKQWGEWTPGENVDRRRGVVEAASWFDNRWLIDRENLACEDQHYLDQPDVYRVGKRAAGRLLDGREYSEFPR